MTARGAGAEEPARRVTREQIDALIYGSRGTPRYTQDSPILPDVWIKYAEEPTRQHELLLSPYQDARIGYTSAGQLSKTLRERLADPGARHPASPTRDRPGAKPAQIAYNQTTVVANLWFDELVRVVIPLSAWWHKLEQRSAMLARLQTSSGQDELVAALKNPLGGRGGLSPDVLWMVHVIGTIELIRSGASDPERGPAWQPLTAEQLNVLDDQARTEYYKQIVASVAELTRGLGATPDGAEKPLVWSVSLNRKARSTVWRSRATVKADAAARLFEISCRDFAWAVIDSGIAATHPAFRKRDKEGKRLASAFAGETNNTRIIATYDFTVVRQLLSDETLEASLPADLANTGGWTDEDRMLLRSSLASGREVDWELLGRFIRVPHVDGKYRSPVHEHGTHVAGILAGDCREDPSLPSTEDCPAGLCPDLQLYDLRVLNDEGEGDEFNVMAALQFVRHLNSHQDAIVVHGANVSLSIRHDIANFACGRTPVCDECERLVGAGVIVVAAAGNDGYLQYLTPRGPQDSYRSISITDPGNAAGVITVGSTHRFQPHTYGVSYFSSRGPTGDGRAKPDIVAPGEKIEAPVPSGEIKRMDGTSMATPHVSGAAALLIARHRELAGQPLRVKQILCATATDLGRERYFQGAGMVDVLRALQSV